MAAPRQRQSARVPPRNLSASDALTELALTIKRATELSIDVCVPATVLTFDPVSQFVDVELDFLEVIYTDDSEQVQEPYELVQLPVQFPGNSRNGFLSFPIKPGDKGLVHVSDRSLETWLEDGVQRDPQLGHTHRVTDGFFVPSIRDRTRAIPGFDPTAAVLENPLIKLGASAALGAARTTDSTLPGPTMLAWIGQVTAAINTLLPGSIPNPPTDFGTITTGSTKVLIE